MVGQPMGGRAGPIVPTRRGVGTNGISPQRGMRQRHGVSCTSSTRVVSPAFQGPDAAEAVELGAPADLHLGPLGQGLGHRETHDVADLPVGGPADGAQVGGCATPTARGTERTRRTRPGSSTGFGGSDGDVAPPDERTPGGRASPRPNSTSHDSSPTVSPTRRSPLGLRCRGTPSTSTSVRSSASSPSARVWRWRGWLGNARAGRSGDRRAPRRTAAPAAGCWGGRGNRPTRPGPIRRRGGTPAVSDVHDAGRFTRPRKPSQPNSPEVPER